MSKTYASIDPRLHAFIQAQQMFFVGTAPSGNDGHINLSPKGLGGLLILNPLEVAYLDYTGSGAETIAHVRENGRIVIMFCAFDGPPNIVRLHGTGEVIEPQDAAFPPLLEKFAADGNPHGPGLRSIIKVQVTRVSDSCGYGVPKYAYQEERTQLPAWSSKKGEPAIAEYRREKNSASLDGLPTLRSLE